MLICNYTHERCRDWVSFVLINLDIFFFLLYLVFKMFPFRYLKWDDAPCDIQGIGSIRVICEIELENYNEHTNSNPPLRNPSQYVIT